MTHSAKPPARPRSASRTAPRLITWGSVGLVLVIVLALVIVGVTGSPGSTHGTGYEKAPQSLTEQLTSIPESLYNAIGVTSPTVPVTAPTPTSGQPELEYPSRSGASLPGIFYFGGEYCPFCAAERWALIAALSRFGDVRNLAMTTSSSTDVYPSTQTFSFYRASFKSEVVALRAVEHYSNTPDPKTGWTILENPTASQTALLHRYDETSSGLDFPFISIGNQFLIQGSQYSPGVLQGLSREQIAAGLKDPTNPVTQAIVSSANYVSASICSVTKNQPGNVCGSSGVMAAARAMKH
jgi:hypothetical protein